MDESTIDYEVLYPGYKRPKDASNELADGDIEKIGQFLLLLQEMKNKNDKRQSAHEGRK